MILLHELLSSYTQGLEKIRHLENRLHRDWGAKLVEARKVAVDTYRRDLLDWELYDKARQVNLEKRQRAWKSREDEKKQRYRTNKAIWEKREAAIRQRHYRRVRKKVIPLWILTFTLFLTGCIVYPLVFFTTTDREILQLLVFLPCIAWLGGSTSAVWAIYEQVRLRNPANPKLPRPRFPEPRPEPAAIKPKLDPLDSKPVLEDPPELDLVNPWLLSINRASFKLPEYTPKTTGEEGEVDLFLLMAEELPDDYLALRNILLRRSLDLDLTVIGPTGIWLLDSKYWAGSIRYGRMGWWRDRSDDEYPLDLGWGNQKKFTIQALQRNYLNFNWEEIVTGGIVFTHSNYSLDLHQSPPVIVDTLENWLQRIRMAEPIPDFSLDVRLQVADALCRYSSMPRLEQFPDFHPTPAGSLADQVYQDVLEKVCQYFEKAGRNK